MASFDAAEFIEAMTKLAADEKFKKRFISQVSASKLAIRVNSELEKIFKDVVATANPDGDPLHIFPTPLPTPKPKKGK